MKRNKTAFNSLIRAVKARVRNAGLDALLVSHAGDMRYLTGFSCEGSRLLIPDHGEPIYFIDQMNAPLAEFSLKDVGLLDIIPGKIYPELRAFMRENTIRRIGIREAAVTIAEIEALKGKSSAFRYVEAGDIVSGMRQIKTQAEIDVMRKAARDTVKIWKVLKKQIAPGITETEIALILETLIRERGLTAPFPAIAATGPNTAFPHSVPSNRKLKRGEICYVDFGVRFMGYCSDLTRVYSKGKIDPQIRLFKDLVSRARDEAVKRIRPGVSIGALVSGINNKFIKQGVGGNILHSLGHGVGVDVHERPFLREGIHARFKKGMIVTVEPGLYLPGLGGVRVEDMVLVNAKGCEVLTV